jgi:magnesium transporter
MNNELMHDELREEILSKIESKDMNGLKALVKDINEVEILDLMEELSNENQAIVFRLLSKDNALFVFERLDVNDQQQLISSFTDEAAIEMITELEPDDRVRLFDELPAAFVKKMLSAISPKEREMTNLLMGYQDETAGHIMTPEYVHLHKDMTAAEALEKIKIDAVEKETIYTIYITDSTRKLEGVISLRDLLIANPADKIENIMQNIAATVSTDTNQEEVARLLQRLSWLAVPVVDKENRLVGIVTIDDAVDILEEEATEYIYEQAGIVDTSGGEGSSEILIKGSLLKKWRIRLPFLMITLVAGLLSGVIIGGFQDTLESIAVVAVFMPLIMDMGGNIGTQSSTIFVRGVVLGHIDVKRFYRHFFKEIMTGMSIGLLIGSIAGTIAAVWGSIAMDVPQLGLAVGLALVFTMTLASLMGFLVPYILMKLKADLAAGSAPLITSVKDFSGLIIYFLLVSTFLRHML